MGIDSHRASSTGVTSPITSSRRVGLLALAIAASWASMLFHNQWELTLTPLDLENTGPLAADIALLAACWWRPWSRFVWTAVLAWGLLNMVAGGIVTVLPLPVLPFAPEQTVNHYAVHAIYTLGQLPLVLLAEGVLRQLRYLKGAPRHGGRS